MIGAPLARPFERFAPLLFAISIAAVPQATAQTCVYSPAAYAQNTADINTIAIPKPIRAAITSPSRTDPPLITAVAPGLGRLLNAIGKRRSIHATTATVNGTCAFITASLTVNRSSSRALPPSALSRANTLAFDLTSFETFPGKPHRVLSSA